MGCRGMLACMHVCVLCNSVCVYVCACKRNMHVSDCLQCVCECMHECVCACLHACIPALSICSMYVRR